jgi:zinc/manganese transport system substrate-binding protein
MKAHATGADLPSRCRRTTARVLVAGLLLASAACNPDGAGVESDLPVVVATTSIAGDIVSNVVGPNATVEVIIGRGVDPHDFTPSARQAATIAGADLIVAFGLGLEEGLDDVLEAAAESGTPIVEIGPAVDPTEAGEDHAAENQSSDEPDGETVAEDHDGLDPHVWQDPIRMAQATTSIAEALTNVASDVDWAARAEAYRTAIEELDAEVRTIIDTIPSDRRSIVTNHESLGYFADRYGLDVIGVVIPGGSTLGEPSAAELADVVGTLETTGVRAIFAENTASSKLADVLASEIGSNVGVYQVYSDSLGEEGSPGDTYVGMIRANAETIAGALR